MAVSVPGSVETLSVLLYLWHSVRGFIYIRRVDYVSRSMHGSMSRSVCGYISRSEHVSMSHCVRGSIYVTLCT